MRKIFTLAAFIFILASLHAQIKKGSIFLGGNLGGYTAKTKSADTLYNKQNQLTISPVFGKAISDNLVFGGNASFVLGKSNNPNGSILENQFYSAGIFLRKYKFLGTSGFSIFAEGDLGYSYNRYKTSHPSLPYISENKRQTIYASAYPGLSYTVSNKLQLETGFNNFLYLSYWNEKTVQESTTASSLETNGVSIGSSLNNISNLYLGFRLLIGK